MSKIYNYNNNNYYYYIIFDFFFSGSKLWLSYKS